MNIYMVISWDDFYPSPDNCRAVFLNKADAQAYLVKIKKKDESDWKYGHYEIIFKRVK